MSGSQTMLTGPFKDARFGPLPNLHTCSVLMEVCRFGQCLGWRFSPIYIFSLACFSRVFSRISLESLGLGNIAQVPGNRPKFGQNGQNHAARSPVSATLSTLQIDRLPQVKYTCLDLGEG